MRKLLVVIVAVLAVAAGYGWYLATARAPAAIRIATEGANPPFNFIDKDGHVAGFDVDIARALCTAMKTRCEIVTQNWDAIIPGLQAGEYDAIISSLSITPQRSQQIAFTDPYYDTPTRFIAPKAAPCRGLGRRPRRQAGRGAARDGAGEAAPQQILPGRAGPL